MDSLETQDSPPLDPSLAPILVFGSGHGGVEAGEETTTNDGSGTSGFLYSIPKRQLLPAAGFGYLNSDASWITPQGWVLTLDPRTRDACLRDPFTSGAVVPLPRDLEGLLPSNNEHSRCLLSTRRPADDPAGCVVLVLHLERPVLWHCSCGSPGPGLPSPSWSRHEYPSELITASSRGVAMWDMSMLTAVRGRFYTSGVSDDRLVTLEFSPAGRPVFSTPRAAITPWLSGCFRVGLVESRGDLFAVRFSLELARGKGVVDIFVYKLVFSDNAWVKVAQLGDSRVFFLGKGTVGASMAAEEVGLKENCIYFTNEDDKGLYVYDMEQGSITLHNPGPDVPDCTEPMFLMPTT